MLPSSGAAAGREPRGYRVEPRTYVDIEYLIAAVRARLVPLASAADPLDALEMFHSLGQFVVVIDARTGRETRIDLAYHVCEDKPFIEGETRFNRRTRAIDVCLTDSAYRALGDKSLARHRAKFSLGHEITHAVGHSGLVVQLGGMSTEDARTLRRETPHRFFEDSEWQANAGSAALWMPADALFDMLEDGALDEVSVAKRFDVSREAAANRIRIFSPRARVLADAAREGRRSDRR